MKKYPKLRCPVCGMVVWLRNLLKIHPVDTFEYTFGIGKGKISVKKAKVKGDIYDYWINRLKEVIKYLEKEKNKRTLQVEIPIKKSSVVLATSVSPKMELKLKSMPSVTLNVPKPSLVISTKKKEKMSR
jgi:hypothetical protein